MTAKTAIESLHTSIEAIKDHDFSGQWSTDIYLDPVAQTVYTFLDTNCTPATAYHNIDRRILSVSPNAIASSVYDWLSNVEDTLASLVGEYEGSEWDGNNDKGKWTEAGEELLDYLNQLPREIASYWDAGEWFSPVEGDLKASWESGLTAEQIIDEQGCGNDVDGMCDRAEAIAWLERKIAEWTADNE